MNAGLSQRKRSKERRSKGASLALIGKATLFSTGASIALVASGVALLSASVLPLTSSAAPSPITIVVSHNATWGATLALKNGDTLYRLSADSRDHSDCTGTCATIWIPVLLAPGQKAPVGVGVRGLGSFTRSNDTRQVTIDGLPLYRFTGDKGAGQVTGNVKDTWGHWWSINPSHPTTPPTKIKTGGSGGSGGTTTTSPPTTTPPPTTTTTAPPGGGIAY
jgi:predicted lipoprotein with Yx(FWY)xxD motif